MNHSQQKKFNLDDLSDVFECLSQILSTDLPNRSLYKLVYNQMQLFSRQDLEKMNKSKEKINLYERCKYIQSPELMSVLIKKKVDWDKLTEYTKWIVETVENPSDSLYELLYNIESLLNKPINKEQKDYYFIEFIHKFCFDLISQEKQLLISKFYEDFFPSFKDEIIEHLIRMAPVKEKIKEENIYSFYQSRFAKEGISLKEYPINLLLPMDDADTDFLINHISLNKIKFLTKYGFHINDENYTFNGENLLGNLLTKHFKQADIIEVFIPHISNFKTKNISPEKVDQLMQGYNERIRTIYLNNKLRKELDSTEKNINIKKMKI